LETKTVKTDGGQRNAILSNVKAVRREVLNLDVFPRKAVRVKLSPKKGRSAILFNNGAIGDFLMFMYLAELLQKSGYVDSSTIVVPRNLTFLEGLTGAYPYISVVEMSRRGGWLQLLKLMRRPSLVVLQPAVGAIPLRLKILGWSISRLCGSELVGFQDKSLLCKALYSKTLVYETDHLFSENIQNIVRALGASVPVEVPVLNINPAQDVIRAFGLAHSAYIVFHPGAGSPKRAFASQAARKIIEHVLERNPKMHVVLSGSTAEEKYIEEIRDGIQKQERVLTAIGRSAQEIAALILSAQLFVGADSGITHLACFLHARVIVAAHHGTANWLPFYCPSATVLYRLKEEATVHESRDYLDAQRRGRLKPFGTVPTDAICASVDRFVCSSRAGEGPAQGIVVSDNPNTLAYSQS